LENPLPSELIFEKELNCVVMDLKEDEIELRKAKYKNVNIF